MGANSPGEEIEASMDLEGVDLTIPEEFELEVMAGLMVDNLKEYQRAIVLERAARHNLDYKRAEELAKIAVNTRTAIALIQKKHPRAKAIADQVMKLEAQRIARAREAMVRDGNQA